MSEEELSELRLRLGVNTFGTFVDRYAVRVRTLCCCRLQAPAMHAHGLGAFCPLTDY